MVRDSAAGLVGARNVTSLCQLPCRFLDPADDFIGRLWEGVPEKPELLALGARTQARLAYWVLLAVALAPRVAEQGPARKFGGRGEGSMPKALGDPAPSWVTDAWFNSDLAVAKRGDSCAEEDAIEGVVRVSKWIDGLRRAFQVSEFVFA